MAQAVYVLLGDLEHSRKAQDRRLLLRRLERLCSDLNHECAASLLAPLKPIKGVDEIGAVLRSVDQLYRIVDAFRRGLKPSRMRIAVVRGDVDVGRATRDVARMDGPAFHGAAQVMGGLKQTGLTFTLVAGEPALDASVSGLTNALLALKSRWTEQQERMASAYELARGQAAAARKLRVTQQAVSQALARMDYRRVRLIEDSLVQSLRAYPRSGEGGRRA